MSKDITHEKIKQASEICYIVLYKAPHKIKALDDLIYIKFMQKLHWEDPLFFPTLSLLHPLLLNTMISVFITK